MRAAGTTAPKRPAADRALSFPVFQLRDALKVGNIQLSTHFFSLKLGVNEALKVVRSELTVRSLLPATRAQFRC